VRFVLLAVPVVVVFASRNLWIADLIGPTRRFMAQQLVFGLMFQALLLHSTRAGPRVLRLAVGVAALAVAWNVAEMIRFAANPDTWGDSYFIAWSTWREDFAKVGHELWAATVAYPAVLRSLLAWFPAALAGAFLLIGLWRSIQSSEPSRSLRAALPILATPVALYLLITALNGAFNRRNVDKLKSRGFFAKMVVGDGMSLFTYDDVVSDAAAIRHQGELRGDVRITEDFNEVLAAVVTDAASHVLVDPIGFREDCRRGKMRPSFFDTWRP
jgi:hypothetical protein